jgi:hypothetical protein
MKKIINPQMSLLAVGVLQPASSAEVRSFLGKIFRDGGDLPVLAEYNDFLESQCADGRLLLVQSNGQARYSLTVLGNQYLLPQSRKVRDKFRIYLLRDAHRNRFALSREVQERKLAGVSPAVDSSIGVKGGAANKDGRRRRSDGHLYWPRIPGQFHKRTGSTRASRDTFPPLLSFEDRTQVAEASQREFLFDHVGIGLCIGVSPQLVWRMSREPARYYRSFELPKKNGGVRKIDSPRNFLKVVQWFLADFVLCELPVHPNAHAFRFGHSIVSNAKPHQDRSFVGCADIENFFGTVTKQMVAALLVGNGFDSTESEVISGLCTKDGVLPQGAPTSPIISNSILNAFDVTMVEFCSSHSLEYSRYADDLTISGDSRANVECALRFATQALRRLGLGLNSAKTRIASKGGQQRVAGVVVNVEAAPPREFRRMVRASFHNALEAPLAHREAVGRLSGYIGYLKLFPKLKESNEVRSYEAALMALRQVQALT